MKNEYKQELKILLTESNNIMMKVHAAKAQKLVEMQPETEPLYTSEMNDLSLHSEEIHAR